MNSAGRVWNTVPSPSVVKKDLSFKAKAKAKDSKCVLGDISRPRTKAKDNNTAHTAKAKDLTLKAKAKAKDLTFKAKAKAKDSKFVFEDISRPRSKAKDNNTALTSIVGVPVPPKRFDMPVRNKSSMYGRT